MFENSSPRFLPTCELCHEGGEYRLHPNEYLECSFRWQECKESHENWLTKHPSGCVEMKLSTLWCLALRAAELSFVSLFTTNSAADRRTEGLMKANNIHFISVTKPKDLSHISKSTFFSQGLVLQKRISRLKFGCALSVQTNGSFQQ